MTNKGEIIEKIIEMNMLTIQFALFIALNTLEEKDLLKVKDECIKGKRFTPGDIEVFFTERREVQDSENVLR
jgi:hypothetical protein